MEKVYIIVLRSKRRSLLRAILDHYSGEEEERREVEAVREIIESLEQPQPDSGFVVGKN